MNNSIGYQIRNSKKCRSSFFEFVEEIWHRNGYFLSWLIKKWFFTVCQKYLTFDDILFPLDLWFGSLHGGLKWNRCSPHNIEHEDYYISYLQGAELLSKAPFKVWNSLLTDLVANKFVYRGIVQTLLDKIMPKYFEPNLDLASGKVICQIHSEIH